MPKRTRSHELEDHSRNRLHNIFVSNGCVVEDLHKDYGEDLLIRVFEQGKATPYAFFVQAKATDHIDKYMHKNRSKLSFPIDIDHADHWNKFWEPVILTIWDANSDITYWESVQTFLERDKNKNRPQAKRVSIDIPLYNILDEQGFKRIVSRTKSRFARFEQEREGAQVLIELIEEALGVKIHYDPQGGLLLIDKEGEDKKVTVFGKIAEGLEGISSDLNISLQEAFEKVIRSGMKLDGMLQGGSELIIKVDGWVEWQGSLEKYGGEVDSMIEVLESSLETKE